MLREREVGHPVTRRARMNTEAQIGLMEKTRLKIGLKESAPSRKVSG